MGRTSPFWAVFQVGKIGGLGGRPGWGGHCKILITHQVREGPGTKPTCFKLTMAGALQYASRKQLFTLRQTQSEACISKFTWRQKLAKPSFSIIFYNAFKEGQGCFLPGAMENPPPLTDPLGGGNPEPQNGANEPILGRFPGG